MWRAFQATNDRHYDGCSCNAQGPAVAEAIRTERETRRAFLRTCPQRAARAQCFCRKSATKARQTHSLFVAAGPGAIEPVIETARALGLVALPASLAARVRRTAVFRLRLVRFMDRGRGRIGRRSHRRSAVLQLRRTAALCDLSNTGWTQREHRGTQRKRDNADRRTGFHCAVKIACERRFEKGIGHKCAKDLE